MPTFILIDTAGRDLKVFAYQAIGLLASRLPSLFRYEIGMKRFKKKKRRRTFRIVQYLVGFRHAAIEVLWHKCAIVCMWTVRSQSEGLEFED